MPNIIIRGPSLAGIFSDNGISGSIVPDGQLRVNALGGEDFGTADITCHLYDDLRGQTAGDTMSTTAVLGTYLNVTTSARVSADNPLFDTGRSMLHDGAGIARMTFPNSPGFRGSFWIYSVTDTGITTGGRSKTSWVMTDSDGASETLDQKLDLAFPTKHFTTNTGWGVAGNDYNLILSVGQWFMAGEWARAMFSFSHTDGWRLKLVSPSVGQTIREGAESVFEIDPQTIEAYVNRWELGATTDPTVYYTGIMCHYGSGSNACVEIGDALNYDDCTQFFDCQIDAWTPTAIDLTIRAPASALTGGYLHIRRADRTHVNSGIGRALS
jgi:hypothetical protein